MSYRTDVLVEATRAATHECRPESPANPTPCMLEAHNLSARRGTSRLFAGLCLKVMRGEVLMVTGANGTGKTTLLRMLAGLSAPAAGTIRWNGTAHLPFSLALRSAVTFIGHQPALKDDLTAEENLSAAMRLANQPESGEALRKALDTVALTAQARLPARLLSQGQRRRIALARLALDRRPLWLLDEPLTALDAAASTLLSQFIRDHVRDGGMVVAATHAPLDLPSAHTHALALS